MKSVARYELFELKDVSRFNSRNPLFKFKCILWLSMKTQEIRCKNDWYKCTYKLWPVWSITSGAIQYGVPFIDFAPVVEDENSRK